MKTIKITPEKAELLRKPFLNSKEKKELGISGYQMVSEYGWYIEKETEKAILLSGFNEVGRYDKYELKEAYLWLPKSQIKVFEYIDTDENDYDKEKTYYLIFVKSWLFNKNKSTIQLNHFKNYGC